MGAEVVLKIRLDPTFNAQIISAARGMQRTFEESARKMADPMLAATVKLRAGLAAGLIPLKQAAAEQQRIIAGIDKEIALLRQKDSLSQQEVARLKQITLERERQANALQRGVGVGVTAGTSSALSQLGFLPGPLGGIEAAATGGPAAILAALTAAAGGAAVGLAKLAIEGGALAQRLDLISQKTGITIRNLQVLEAIGRTNKVELEDIVTGYRKFAQVLAGGGAEGEGFEGATKKSAKVLQALGVTSRDSFGALLQVADAFAKLPDGPIKAAVAVELFGRSGLNMIPILNKGSKAILEQQAIVAMYGPTITTGVLKAQVQWELSTLALDLSLKKLKTTLTQDLLPDMAKYLFFLIAIGQRTAEEAKKRGIIPAAATFPANLIPGPVGEMFFPKMPGVSILGERVAQQQQEAAEKAMGETLPPELRKFFEGVAAALREVKKESKEAKEEFQKFLERALFPGAASRQGLEVFKSFQQMESLRTGGIMALGFAPAQILGIGAPDEKRVVQSLGNILKVGQSIEDRIFNLKLRNIDLLFTKEKDRILLKGELEKQRILEKAKLEGATADQLADLERVLNQETQMKLAEAQKARFESLISEIKSSAGQVFDAMLTKGQSVFKSLANFVQGIFQTVLRTVFTHFVESAARRVLTFVGPLVRGIPGIGGTLADIFGLPGGKKTDENVAGIKQDTSRIVALLSGGGGAGSGGGMGGGVIGNLLRRIPGLGGILGAPLGAAAAGGAVNAAGMFIGAGAGTAAGALTAGGVNAAGMAVGGLSAGLASGLATFGIGAAVTLAIMGITKLIQHIVTGALRREEGRATAVSAAMRRQLFEMPGAAKFLFADAPDIGSIFGSTIGERPIASSPFFVTPQAAGFTTGQTIVVAPNITFAVRAMDSQDVNAFFSNHGRIIASAIRGNIEEVVHSSTLSSARLGARMREMVIIP